MLNLTGPEGREQIEPPAVVLATGCRERPRSARLVPGSRPAGVMTTSTLQQLVHLRGEKVGSRAVIVGAEHVSFSAVATLAHAGASVAGLVTELPRHQSLAAFRAGAALRYRTSVWPHTAISAIHGSERVESVEVTDLDSGRTRSVDCDLVIFTADWIPDHELAVMAGCELDPGSLGPLVDQALGTTRRGVFAAGNLLHPAETADICALDGRHVCGARGRLLAWPGRVAGTPPPGGARAAGLGGAESPPGGRSVASSQPVPAPLPRDPAASAGPGSAGREGALARPAAEARSGPLGPHPRWVDLAGRSHGRSGDHRSWVGARTRCRIGLPRERRRAVARHRRGDDRGQGRALRPAAPAGRGGAPRQGQPPPRGGLG